MNKSLARREWKHRFTTALPGDPEPLNYTRIVENIIYSETVPTPVGDPKLLGWSEDLARDLNVERPRDAESLALLAGNAVPHGAKPYAMRYGGHQFGHWAGQLGDGRAITLGEIEDAKGRDQEVQLKGAGPTPYSRRADGRAVLRSSMREFLCSEAMHHLGVPTTRALSLVTTGEAVTRDMFYDGHPRPEPGAIVARVAPSFLRFGNFEILAAQGEHALLKKLADFTIEYYFPEIQTANDPAEKYGLFFDAVAKRTAKLMAEWLRVGFVHGVMNTDNMSILGLTIDYGPYGWLEPYEPHWTPNTTDARVGRYGFNQQPTMAQWNLAQLGQALLPLIKMPDRVKDSLRLFRETFYTDYQEAFAKKLGVDAFLDLQNEWDELFSLLEISSADMTQFFRRLNQWPIDAPDELFEKNFLSLIAPTFYGEVSPEWIARWQKWFGIYRSLRQRADPARARGMNTVNPKYVLRNYLAQNAIFAAEKGDLNPFVQLQLVLKNPYAEQPEFEGLADKRPAWAKFAPGSATLSCSS